MTDRVFESKRAEQEYYQMSVKQLAKRIGWNPDALLQALWGQNYKIPSVDTRVGGIITQPLIVEFEKNGVVEIKPAATGPSVAKSRPVRKQAGGRSSVRLNPKYRNGHDFEAAVGDFISKRLPNSHLSNVFLFLAERLSTTDKYGREIDHLLHLRRGTEHRLVIVECKHSNLELEGRSSIKQEKDWIVETTAGRKEVRDQMWIQARALMQLLKPIPEVDLVVEAIALLSDENAESIQDTAGKDDSRVNYRVMGLHDLGGYLDEMSETYEFFRVGQSEFLRRLRQGMRCSQLGHPDIRDAIDYHRRSRQTLDYGLFQHFNPTKGKWAINGTAGMGKSVLLAYALCAFSTDHKLVLQKNGELKLVEADLEKQQLPPLQERKIVVFSLKEKQRRIIEHFFRHLIDDFQAHDHQNVLRIQRPSIRRWQLGEEIDGNVVLIDEAHDLSDEAQKKVTNWLNADPDNRYLVIACDRHQKLRLIGDSDHKRMIAGLHFGRHTKALKRVYRNPFSVYAAGLGLMFRWFAPHGPKVIPDQAQLKKDFGFKVNKRSDEKGGICDFEMTEDAHPGNHWHHCVSNFPDAETAHRWLAQYQLGQSEVLWVRFHDEDPDFDYEQLQCYQYHNLNTSESASIIDKYIKGQEFPVVIIEGTGPKFNDFEDQDGMFAHRRELYLSASRATVFLFFIYSGAQGGTGEVNQELENLRQQLSLPIEESKSSQRWGVDFEIASKAIPLTQFEDLVDPLEGFETSAVEEIEEVKEIEGTVELDESSNSDDSIEIAEPAAVMSPAVVGESDDEPEDSQELPSVEGDVSVASPRAEPLSFSAAIRARFEEDLDESQLQAESHGIPYTPIDFYTPAILAHYLKVDQGALLAILAEFDLSAEPMGRIPYTTVQQVTNALNVPEPWNHPELAEKPEDVYVQYKGVALTHANLATRIVSSFIGDRHETGRVEAAIKGLFRWPEGKTHERVQLLEFAKLANYLKLNGDECLEHIRPYRKVRGVEGTNPVVNQELRNTGGYSVLDTYTPRSLAEYLDMKPFKVMAELMKVPKVMNLTLNHSLELELVEKVCRNVQRTAPWKHPTLGNSIPKVVIVFWGKQVVTVANLPDLINQIYTTKPRNFRHLITRLKERRTEKDGGNTCLSATEIYEALQKLQLKPGTMLRLMQAYR